MKVISLSIVALLVVSLLGCQSTDPSGLRPGELVDEPVLTQKVVRFIIEDIPASFWATPQEGGRLHYSFFLFGPGTKLAEPDVKSILAADEFDSYWELTPTFTRNTVGGWFRCTTTDLSLDMTVLSLGRYTLDFELNDGTVIRKMTAPGEHLAGASGHRYLYSNEYKGVIKSGFLKTLTRPVVRAVRVEDDVLVLDFEANDKRITNFSVSLYDYQRRSIGDAPLFVNTLSGQISAHLNQGTGFYTDGRRNQILLPSASVQFEKEQSFQDLATIIVEVNNTSPQVHTTDYVDLFSKSERVWLE